MYTPSTDVWHISDGQHRRQLAPAMFRIRGRRLGCAILLPNGNVFAISASGNTAIYTPGAAGIAVRTSVERGRTLVVDSSNNTLFPMDAPAVLLTNGQVLLTALKSKPALQLPEPDDIFPVQLLDQQSDDHDRPFEQQ